jgi:hypothetical protein
MDFFNQRAIQSVEGTGLTSNNENPEIGRNKPNVISNESFYYSFNWEIMMRIISFLISLFVPPRNLKTFKRLGCIKWIVRWIITLGVGVFSVIIFIISSHYFSNDNCKERVRWLALMLMALTTYLIVFIVKLNMNKTLLKCIFDKVKSSRSIGKNYQDKKRCIWFRFSWCLISIFTYWIFFCMITQHLIEKFQDHIPPFRKYAWIPIYLVFQVTVVIYIITCWILYSKFKHLNKTIKEFTKESSRNVEDLNEFIEWFGDNIYQVSKFNNIFSFSMAVFFCVQSCGLVLAMEDLFFMYNVKEYGIFAYNIYFNVYRIVMVIYIVKQTNDISLEASSTSKYLNEYCHSKDSGELELEKSPFQRKV